MGHWSVSYLLARVLQSLSDFKVWVVQAVLRFGLFKWAVSYVLLVIISGFALPVAVWILFPGALFLGFVLFLADKLVKPDRPNTGMTWPFGPPAPMDEDMKDDLRSVAVLLAIPMLSSLVAFGLLTIVLEVRL